VLCDGIGMLFSQAGMAGGKVEELQDRSTEVLDVLNLLPLGSPPTKEGTK
jgi:hypothetical protein